MYVGWLFDSNQIEVTVMADCEFNSTWPQTPSHFLLELYQEHKSINRISGGNGFWESPERQNNPEINVTQRNQERSPQNTTGRNTKTLKILRIICILLAPSVRKNLECTNRNECSKTKGSYSVHLALLTLLIREIQKFYW
jgi:hypothetical protein